MSLPSRRGRPWLGMVLLQPFVGPSELEGFLEDLDRALAAPAVAAGT